jgi:hypothetical protein
MPKFIPVYSKPSKYITSDFNVNVCQKSELLRGELRVVMRKCMRGRSKRIGRTYNLIEEVYRPEKSLENEYYV